MKELLRTLQAQKLWPMKPQTVVWMPPPVQLPSLHTAAIGWTLLPELIHHGSEAFRGPLHGLKISHPVIDHSIFHAVINVVCALLTIQLETVGGVQHTQITTASAQQTAAICHRCVIQESLVSQRDLWGFQHVAD